MKSAGMTTNEAGAYVGCSAAALRHWRKTGRGPRFYRAGRLIRYKHEDLDAWISRHSCPRSDAETVVSSEDVPAISPP
jgi:excisionase family DNA binding protein